MSVGMKDDCLSSVIWKIVTEEEKKEIKMTKEEKKKDIMKNEIREEQWIASRGFSGIGCDVY